MHYFIIARAGLGTGKHQRGSDHASVRNAVVQKSNRLLEGRLPTVLTIAAWQSGTEEPLYRDNVSAGGRLSSSRPTVKAAKPMQLQLHGVSGIMPRGMRLGPVNSWPCPPDLVLCLTSRAAAVRSSFKRASVWPSSSTPALPPGMTACSGLRDCPVTPCNESTSSCFLLGLLVAQEVTMDLELHAAWCMLQRHGAEICNSR